METDDCSGGVCDAREFGPVGDRKYNKEARGRVLREGLNGALIK